MKWINKDGSPVRVTNDDNRKLPKYVHEHQGAYRAEISIDGQRYRKRCPTIADAARFLIPILQDEVSYLMDENDEFAGMGMSSNELKAEEYKLRIRQLQSYIGQ